jgi:hypothetical protein
MRRWLRCCFRFWTNFVCQVDGPAALSSEILNCSKCRAPLRNSRNIPGQEDADTSESFHPLRRVRRNRIPNHAKIRSGEREGSPRTVQCGRDLLPKLVRWPSQEHIAVRRSRLRKGSCAKRIPVHADVLHRHGASASVNCSSQKVA